MHVRGRKQLSWNRISKNSSGFTLIELLIILGVLSVLAVVGVLLLNPQERLAQARDVKRIQEARNIEKAINFYIDRTLQTTGTPDLDGPNFSDACANQANPLLFASVPDSELPPDNPSGFVINQVVNNTLHNNDGSGWLPINFIETGSTNSFLQAVPIDPVNSFENSFYYRYVCDATSGKYEINLNLESEKFKLQEQTDGGDDPNLFEVGSNLVLSPADTGPPPTEDTAILCSDGIDNDNDGLIDFDDPDCDAFIPPPIANIEIIRDTWGVPHVFAETDEGAFFGAGYATAEDRLYQMHRIRMSMHGRLAELIGDKGSGVNNTIRRDKNARRLGYARYADQKFINLDTVTRSLLQAYADGVNHYINEHDFSDPSPVNDLFDNVAPEPWVPTDSLLAWDAIFLSGIPFSEEDNLHTYENLLSQGNTPEEAVALMVKTIITDDDTASARLEDVNPATVQAMQNYAALHPPFAGITFNETGPPPKMSHTWAVGDSRTTTGSTVFVGDPQLNIDSPSIFHEIHVQGYSFNARGVTIPGAVGFYAGFNENVAWSGTRLAADSEDLFRLKMVGPDQYEYDGQTYTMSVFNEQILVKNGPAEPFTVKETILGPVVTDEVNAFVGEEYILRSLAITDTSTHTARAALNMIKADTSFELSQSFVDWRGANVNLVFADSSGVVGYWYLAPIPERSSAWPLSGHIAGDGSSSALGWSGVVPYDLLPHMIDPPNDIAFNANHLSSGSWYPVNLGSTLGGGGDTFRSWRLSELLDRDGTSVFTPAQVRSIHYDRVQPARRDVVVIGLHLRDVQGISFSPSANNALNILDSWLASGAHNTFNEPYLAAAHHINLDFFFSNVPVLRVLYGGGDSGLSAWMRAVKNRIAANGALTVFSQEEIDFIDASLADGWDGAVSNYGVDPNDWQVNFQAAKGNYTTRYFKTLLFNYLSPSPEYNKTYTGFQSPVLNTLASQKSQAYTQWIDFGDLDSAQALLPMGNSEDPESDFFNNQAIPWEADSLREAPLSKSVVKTMEYSTTFLDYP